MKQRRLQQSRMRMPRTRLMVEGEAEKRRLIHVNRGIGEAWSAWVRENINARDMSLIAFIAVRPW